jgi:hypothetical protein
MEDNDGCSLPTHVVEKNDEIVGCASIALVPVLMMWHHTKKIGPKESMQLKNTYESILEEKGVNQYIILCKQEQSLQSTHFGYDCMGIRIFTIYL